MKRRIWIITRDKAGKLKIMLDTVVILVHPATLNALEQVNLASRFAWRSMLHV